MTLTINESPVVLVAVYSKNVPGGLIDMSDKVLSFEYHDSDTKADKCTLTVRNDDWSNFDTRIWRQGARLRVQWGYFNNLAPPRELVIQAERSGKKTKKGGGKGGKGGQSSPAIKGATELTIEAHGLAVLMNRKKVVRTFRQKTRSEIAASIAEAWGFGPAARFITPTYVVVPTVTQASMTDAELLAKLAKAEGFKFYLDYDGFHFHPRDFNQRPKRVWSWFAARENKEAVIDVDIENDATIMRPKGIRAKGIDKKTGKVFEQGASNVDTERTGLAPTLAGPENIAAKLTSSDPDVLLSEGPDLNEDNTIEIIDWRDATTFDAALEAPTDTLNAADAHTADDAKTKVDAKYRELVACAVKLNLTVLGDPAFGAKSVFFFECPSKRITGRYYAKEVTHSIAAGDYTMSIKSISDGGNDGKGKKSAAKVNQQNPPEDSAEELEEVEYIDPRDGTTSTSYRVGR